MDDKILSRVEYALLSRFGRPHRIIIALERPRTSDGLLWNCKVSVSIMGVVIVEDTVGVDETQALRMALGKLAFAGYWLRTRFGDRLRWGDVAFNRVLQSSPSMRIEELLACGRANELWDAIKATPLAAEFPAGSI